MSTRDEELVDDMLLWLAREPRRLAGFLRATGYTPRSLREEADGMALRLAVLEFLMNDESLLLQFCAETDTPPETAAILWRRVAGD